MAKIFFSILIVVSMAWLSACASPNTNPLASAIPPAQNTNPLASEIPPAQNTNPLASAIPPTAKLPAVPPATCPITMPAGAAFTPPTPYPATPPANYPGQFWYGTADLWTLLRVDGTWAELPFSNAGYSQKLFWWRQGYSSSSEPNPKLTVTGKRLDASAAPLATSAASNATSDLGESMDIGLVIPTPGCWEITGQYNGHNLSFVVWVAP